MTGWQAILIAIIQGMTELFPVSSLGHAVVLPAILNWHINQNDPSFLPFLVVLHLGTAIALLVYFWSDWVNIVLAVFGLGDPEERKGQLTTLWYLVLATIPAVILGGIFEKSLRHLFGSPLIAAMFIIANGCILFVGERLRRHCSDGVITDMKWYQVLLIGFWQCTALIPGISRSGATMVGGILSGLHHREAARFSFLMATPIIFGAGVLEVPHFFHHQAESGGFGPLVWIAGLAAGLTAYASTAFLMRYFGKHDFEALDPFAYYCWVFGIISLWLLY